MIVCVHTYIHMRAITFIIIIIAKKKKNENKIKKRPTKIEKKWNEMKIILKKQKN